MKPLGMLLLITGFLGGAYVASLDALTTDWSSFLPAFGVAVVGLFLHRRAEREASTSEERVGEDRRVLGESLDRICAGLEQLRADKASIPTHAMRFEIDRLFREDLRRFADARETMAHLYGLQAYADIMSAFAAGERYLNRVWSASTDGYVDEVLGYVDRAAQQFADAKRLFDAQVALTP